jgi:hypothetical protein
MRIPARSLFIALALIGLALILAPTGAGEQKVPTQVREEPENYDIRFNGRSLLVPLEEAYGASSFRAMREAGAEAVRAMDSARQFAPGVEVRRSSPVGSAEKVRSLRGRLTKEAPGRPTTQTVLTFLHDQAATYGLDRRQADELEVLGESVSRDSGLRMVRLRQRVRGLSVFQSETRAILDREGRLVATVGRLVPGIQDDLVPDFQGLLRPEEALRHALASVGMKVDVTRLHLRDATGSRGAVEMVSEDPRLPRPIHSERVYFPISAGVIVPGWSQVAYVAGDTTWYTVVDGRTGMLLYRKNLREAVSRRDARFSVYAESDGHPLDSPAPGSPNHLTPGSGTQFPAVTRSVISMFAVMDPVASPDGWIPDNVTTTTGNNVDAFLNRNDDLIPDKMTLDSNGRPMGNPDLNGKKRDFLGAAPRDFSYSPAPLGSDPDAGDDPSTAPFQRGAVTNVFYLANWWHDRLYRLGFDEAAGNYQKNNFRRGGEDGDRILISVQQGADAGFFNNAGATMVPDGQSGAIDLNLFDAPGPDRDSGLDAGVLLHELTHLLTGRIVGNGAGLNFGVPRGLGEGWSDFYAMALLYDHPGDDPDAQYASSAYSFYLVGFGPLPPGTFRDNYLYADRSFPYTTDNSINPLTLADADPTTFDFSGGIAPSPFELQRSGASDSHHLGTIWATMLWEVRSRIIAAHGSVPAGNEVTLQVVTDALKLTPTDPSFRDARDAVLDADCATNACAHEEAIWAGFADRGLGYGATDSGSFTNNSGIQESFSVPSLDVAGVSVSDPLGNGNGFAEPGETVNLTVSLVNPWRQAGKGVASAQATLSAVGSDATVLQGSSTYGTIPPQGETAGTPFVVTLNSGLACGAAFKFTLSVSSSLGQSNLELTLRAGRPAGAGSPLTFTHAISGGLPIPDNSGTGVIDALLISGDLDIADLDFRVDDLQHTFVGNLTLALRSPGSLLTDVIWRPGQCFTSPNGVTTCTQATNSGDNFIGTVIDDASTRDLIHAGPSFAPFTGDWMPATNSPNPPFWNDPAPVGQLSRYNGRSTAGTWKLVVTDQRAGNTGTLNSWSLVVTPVSYACGP